MQLSRVSSRQPGSERDRDSWRECGEAEKQSKVDSEGKSEEELNWADSKRMKKQ